MKGLQALIFSVIFSIFSPSLLLGNSYDYRYKDAIHVYSASTEEGLSQAAVSSILRDSDGYVWIATDNGLNRYNGYEFEVFRHEHGNNNSIVSVQDMRAFLEDINQGIWMGSSVGVSYFDKKTGAFTNYTKAEGKSIGLVFEITQTNDGDVYFVSSNGLFVYDNKNKKMLSFKSYSGHDIDTVPFDVYAVDNTVWISDQQCIYSYEYKKKKLFNYCQTPQIKKLRQLTTFAFIRYYNNKLYVSGPKGLFALDITTLNWKHYTNKEYGNFCDDNIKDIEFDENHNFWIGTAAGLSHYKLDDSSFECYKSSIANKSSLASNDIISLHVDKMGLVWVGTSAHGFSIFDTKKNVFSEMVIGSQEEVDDMGHVISNIVKDQSNILWLGSTTHYTVKFDLMTNELVTDDFISKEIDSNDTYRFDSMNIDSNNRLWVCLNEKIKLIDLNKEESFDIKLYLNNKHYPRFVCNHLHERHNGDLLFLAKNGVFEFNKLIKKDKGYELYLLRSGSELLKLNKATNDSSVTTFVETIDGEFWAGTEDGLWRYSKDRQHWYQYKYDINNPQSISNNSIIELFIDSKKNIWVGTYNGLNKVVRGETQEQIYFQRITKKQGLPSNTISAIIEDFSGNLWISTANGLVRYSENLDKIDLFEKNDGLSTSEFHKRSAYLDDSGKIFLGTSNGITVINKKIEGLIDRQRNLKFTKVQIGERFVDSYQLNRVKQPEIEMYENEKMLKVSVADLYYRKIGSQTYRYKMNGIDDDWKFLNKERSIVFAGLPEGSYMLDIQSKMPREDWPEESLKLKVNVKQNFFESKNITYLMLSLAFTLFLLLIYWVRRYYLKGYLRLQNKLKVENLRLKESKKDNLILNRELSDKQNKLLTLTENLTETSLKLEDQKFKDPITQLYYFSGLEKIIEQSNYSKNFSLLSNAIFLIDLLEKEQVYNDYGVTSLAEIGRHIALELKNTLPADAQVFQNDSASFLVFLKFSDATAFLNRIKKIKNRLELSQISVANQRSYKPSLAISTMNFFEQNITRATDLFNLGKLLTQLHNKNLISGNQQIMQISIRSFDRDIFVNLELEQLLEKKLIDYCFLNK